MKISLQQAADQRITKNPEFEKLLVKIDAYVKQKDDKTISLKESDFLARRNLALGGMARVEDIRADSIRNINHVQAEFVSGEIDERRSRLPNPAERQRLADVIRAKASAFRDLDLVDTAG